MGNDKILVKLSLFYAFIIILVMWIVKIVEDICGINFAQFGILPLSTYGLAGIIFAPLIHANYTHLMSNTIPMFLLFAALVYYYKNKAFQILLISWLLTGCFVWLFARGDSYHIGASGVVYALVAFHFTSGVLHKVPNLMAFSLLVVFLYGGIVWGMFPQFVKSQNISWESHSMGAMVGLLLAFVYRKSAPKRKIYSWELEEEENENDDDIENTEILKDSKDFTAKADT